MNNRNPSPEITRVPAHGERPSQIARTEDLQKAFQGIGKIDAKQFFADIDAIADPTPREWFDKEW